MSTLHSQNCPLCSNPAEYEFVDVERHKHFLCATCTEFYVSIYVEARLAKIPPELKSNLSKMANERPEGSTLVIRHPTSKKDEGGPQRELDTEYVRDSELPR